MDDFLESVERTESDAAKAWNLAEYVSSVSLLKCYWCGSLVLTVSLSTGAHRMTVFSLTFMLQLCICTAVCSTSFFVSFSHIWGGARAGMGWMMFPPSQKSRKECSTKKK